MKTAAIVGAGLIGQGWAIVFARAGWQVNVYDPQEGAAQRAKALIEVQLETLHQEGMVADPAGALSRIRVSPSLQEALAGVAYVQESSPEILEVKRALFEQLDSLSPPHAILGSSTSTMPASEFTEHLPGRERCLVAHPVNPTYLVPIVELCGAPWTSAEMIERARVLLMEVGQKPVVLNREVEGFVLNRLQGAVLHEAFRLFSEGVASAEDIDATIKHGLGLRWAFIGPFETLDLNSPNGIAEYCERYSGVYESIGASLGKCVPWSGETLQKITRERRDAVPADQLEQRRLWRDQKLMGLVKQLYKP